MKTIILVTAMLLSMATISYGKPKNRDNQLVKSLNTAIKTSSVISASSNEMFQKATFDFNGKSVNAFYDVDNNELIGFSIPVSESDLPQGALNDIKKKFSHYNIKEMIMFIYKTGLYGFYVSLTAPNVPTIAVSVNAKGKAHYYAKML